MKIIKSRPQTHKGWRTIGRRKWYFKSKWEMNYARYLNWLRKNKQIKKWDYEPDTFWFDGIRRGVTNYKPDFKVWENNGDIIYHEVKGYMDAKSKTKIKRMAKYHPDTKLIVIERKKYNEIKTKLCRVIPGWEF